MPITLKADLEISINTAAWGGFSDPGIYISTDTPTPRFNIRSEGARLIITPDNANSPYVTSAVVSDNRTFFGTTSGDTTSRNYIIPLSGWLTPTQVASGIANYTINIPANTSSVTNGIYWVSQSKEQVFKAKIRAQLNPNSIIRKCDQLITLNADKAEQKARLLLRDMIGDKAFRDYMRRGFIMVKGASGVLYQIMGGHNRITSFIKNTQGKYEPFEGFCVVFKDRDLPYTDWVIMRKILIETDEFGLRKVANVWKINNNASYVAGAVA